MERLELRGKHVRLRPITDADRQRIREIRRTSAADDTAAISCYAKVGYQPVGVMRSYERRADGSWSDGLLMDMLHIDRRPA